jgi:hypothetical protein
MSSFQTSWGKKEGKKRDEGRRTKLITSRSKTGGGEGVSMLKHHIHIII